MVHGTHLGTSSRACTTGAQADSSRVCITDTQTPHSQAREEGTHVLYAVKLPADAGATLKITTTAIYTDVLTAYPREIYQTENQYMVSTILHGVRFCSPHLSLHRTCVYTPACLCSCTAIVSTCQVRTQPCDKKRRCCSAVRLLVAITSAMEATTQ